MTKLSLKLQIGLSFAMLVLILAGLGIVGYREALTTESISKNVSYYTNKKERVLELLSIIEKKKVGGRDALLTDKRDELQSARIEFRSKSDELKAIINTDQGRALFADILQDSAVYDDIVDRSLDLKHAGNVQPAIDLFYSPEAKQARADLGKATNLLEDWFEKQKTQSIDQQTASNASSKLLIMILSLGGLVAGLVIATVITYSVTTGIKLLVEVVEPISRGDLSVDVPRELISRKDEIGILATSMQNMSENLRRLVGSISTGIDTLASSATQLSAISKETAGGTAAVSDKALSVAAAAEEASANTLSIAAGMEQSNSSLSSVASATEEMSATVGDISANTSRARAISEKASGQAQTITDQMQKLGRAAEEIGNVTETINNISAQTNLLALNATIEAARAGSAGKGFAVVANEIKELARQTAEATEDIKARINGIQGSTNSAIKEIGDITAVIKDVGTIVSSIAAAIEEQATVTRDVAGNIAQASDGVREANERVSHTAEVSKTIARDISDVNAAVVHMRHGGEQVQSSAADLSRLAEELGARVAQFRV